MYRVWHSAESFADYIIDKTVLHSKQVVKKPLKESRKERKLVSG